MTTKPLALIIRTAGTNCDRELEHAFRLAGAATEMIHLRRLIDDPVRLQKYDLVGIPGGFSYGDDLGAGRIFALFLRERLYQPLVELVERGAPIIAPCNGFQVLVKMGLLPGPIGDATTEFAHHHGASAEASIAAAAALESSPRRAPNSSDSLNGPQSAVAECAVAGAIGAAGWPVDEPPTPTVTLAPNAGGRFIDAWVDIEFNPDSPCIWTRGLERASHSASQRESTSKRDSGDSRPHEASAAPPAPRINRLPIAHGEGRFVTDSQATLDALERNNLIALRYASGSGESGNPNGSVNRIAGICDRAGLIFGLMPHPERYTKWAHHPQFTRLDRTTVEREEPIGLRMFRNAVEYAVERRR